MNHCCISIRKLRQSMMSVSLETSESMNTLNPALLSIFAKAVYLKRYGKENEHYANATDSLVAGRVGKAGSGFHPTFSK